MSHDSTVYNLRWSTDVHPATKQPPTIQQQILLHQNKDIFLATSTHHLLTSSQHQHFHSFSQLNLVTSSTEDKSLSKVRVWLCLWLNKIIIIYFLESGLNKFLPYSHWLCYLSAIYPHFDIVVVCQCLYYDTKIFDQWSISGSFKRDKLITTINNVCGGFFSKP